MRVFDFSGNVTEGATPVPIPNTEVKPFEVDGTIVARLRESRKLPVYFKKGSLNESPFLLESPPLQ